MKKVIQFLFFACFSFPLFAQVSLSIDDYQASPQEVFTVNVRTTGFMDVVGMQFSLNWDPAILELVGHGDYGLQDLTEDQFNLLGSSGALAVVWIDMALLGQTVEDDAVLFSLTFKAIADEGVAMLAFSGTPTAMEFTGPNGVLDLNLDEDEEMGISIGAVTSVVDLQQKGIHLYQNDPNPFKEYTTIQIDVERATRGSLKVLDQAGKELYNEVRFFTQGTHKVKLDRSMFPSAGIYYYQLLTDNYARTKQLAVIR